MATLKTRNRRKGKPGQRTNQTSMRSQSVSAVEQTPWYKTLKFYASSPVLFLRKLPRWLWVSSSAFITVLATLVVFLPRVTVEPSASYDPSNPSPVIFTIANVNFVPLRNVQPQLGICHLASDVPPDASLPQIGCNGPAVIKMGLSRWFVSWLDTDEEYQIALEELLALPGARQFEVADITIAIEYNLWRMPWRNTTEFRFVTKQRSDGKIYWVPTPLNR